MFNTENDCINTPTKLLFCCLCTCIYVYLAKVVLVIFLYFCGLWIGMYIYIYCLGGWDYQTLCKSHVWLLSMKMLAKLRKVLWIEIVFYYQWCYRMLACLLSIILVWITNIFEILRKKNKKKSLLICSRTKFVMAKRSSLLKTYIS